MNQAEKRHLAKQGSYRGPAGLRSNHHCCAVVGSDDFFNVPFQVWNELTEALYLRCQVAHLQRHKQNGMLPMKASRFLYKRGPENDSQSSVVAPFTSAATSYETQVYSRLTFNLDSWLQGLGR